MTYLEFLNKYNGKYVDRDGYYGPQCMDLVQIYAQELGLGLFSGNAADVAGQQPRGWSKVSSPRQGDVVVYARAADNGWFGHIAIVHQLPVVFGQNYPTNAPSQLRSTAGTHIAYLRPQGLDTNQENPNEMYKGATAADWNRDSVRGQIYRITGNIHDDADLKKNHQGKRPEEIEVDFFDRYPTEWEDGINAAYKKHYNRKATKAEIEEKRAARVGVPRLWFELLGTKAG